MIEDFESSLGNALNQMNSIPIEVNPLEIAIKSRDGQVSEHASDKKRLEDSTKDSEKASEVSKINEPQNIQTTKGLTSDINQKAVYSNPGPEKVTSLSKQKEELPMENEKWKFFRKVNEQKVQKTFLMVFKFLVKCKEFFNF